MSRPIPGIVVGRICGRKRRQKIWGRAQFAAAINAFNCALAVFGLLTGRS